MLILRTEFLLMEGVKKGIKKKLYGAKKPNIKGQLNFAAVQMKKCERYINT